jgi:hypothetical protein
VPGAPFTFRSATVGAPGTAGVSTVIPLPAGVQDGDLLFAAMTNTSGAVVSNAAGWTRILSAVSNGFGFVSVFWKKKAPGDPASATFTHTSTTRLVNTMGAWIEAGFVAGGYTVANIANTTVFRGFATPAAGVTPTNVGLTAGAPGTYMEILIQSVATRLGSADPTVTVAWDALTTGQLARAALTIAASHANEVLELSDSFVNPGNPPALTNSISAVNLTGAGTLRPGLFRALVNVPQATPGAQPFQVI